MTSRGRRERIRSQFDITVGDRRLFFMTQSGVFSQDGPDEGTLLLLQTIMPVVKPHHVVLDLGAGAGVLGVAISGLVPRGGVWMVDSDIRAVRLIEENITLNG